MCLFPVRAEKQEFGRPKLDPEGQLQLPCGKCVECQSKRAVEWAQRARHEIATHDENCFLTLTYDNDNLPSYLIVKTEFQKFMKKLRKKTKNKLRYMVSHEYGGKTGRPHHHVIVFGWNPNNQNFLMKAPSGEPLFTSPDLEKLWPHGYHSIGTANEKTAYYIASYALKSAKHDIVHPDTNEIITVSDSMDASKRPAIGYNFLMKNYQQMIDSEQPMPRYYQKVLERELPEKFQEYQDIHAGKQHQQRSTHEKLAKFVITEQQKNEADNNYRNYSQNKKEMLQYKHHLRFNRDTYVTYNKRKEDDKIKPIRN